MVRLVIVLTVAAVVTAMAAVPVMAQQTSGSGELIAQANPKAAEKQAAREAERQAKRAQIAAQIEAAGYEIPDEAKAKAGMQGQIEVQEKAQEQKKALPKSGGVGSASLLALGAGTLIVGGGLLVYKRARR